MNLGMSEMIFIFLLALILFGPKKLPEIGREVGRFMAEFKRASNNFQQQLASEIKMVDTDLAPSPTTLQVGAQRSSSFTQSLLPAAVTSAISEIDTVHERLMQTSKKAFEAQSFTLHTSESPLVAAPAPAAPDPVVQGS